MDFDAFNDVFVVSDLAEVVTWGAQGGGGGNIPAVLSLQPEEVDLGGELTLSMIAGRAGCRASDVPGLSVRDTITTKRGDTFRVLRFFTDETGWLTMFLGRGI